ncbi:MAG: TonB-dependent receptor domain-containing protein, partial [Phenylobacterium sp.]
SNNRSQANAEYNWTNTFGGEHDWEGWDVSWRLNYTQTEDGFDLPSGVNFASPTDPTLRPTVDYDFTDDSNHTVRLFRTVVTGTGATAVRSRGAPVTFIDDFQIPLVTSGLAIQTVDGGEPTFAYTGKFDIGRDAELFGSPLRVKFGGLYSVLTKKREEKTFGATAAQLATAGRTFNYDAFRNLKPYQAELALGYTFNYFTKKDQDKLANDLLKAGVLTRVDTNANYFRVQEEILSGYAMGTLDQPWGNIVAGLRVERTKNSGEAFGGVGTANRLISVSNDQVLVFPSAHVNWNLNEDMKVRVGLTTGASRPDFDELRPNLVAFDTTQTISGGNPDAKPERSIGGDSYFEWYMLPRGFLSVGVYYKDLKDVLFTQSGVFGRDVLNSAGIDRSGYTLSTLRNGGSGHLMGFEASVNQSIETFLENSDVPDWIKGVGVQANLNINDSEVTVPAAGGAPARKVPLPGASDLVYNVSIYYERYGVSARLAYQTRTEWGQSIGEFQTLNGLVVPVTNGDVYWDDDEEVDLSIRYRINDNFEWTFDAVNLTNDAGRRYANEPGKPIEYARFGRRSLMGVSFTF